MSSHLSFYFSCIGTKLNNIMSVTDYIAHQFIIIISIADLDTHSFLNHDVPKKLMKIKINIVQFERILLCNFLGLFPN